MKHTCDRLIRWRVTPFSDNSDKSAIFPHSNNNFWHNRNTLPSEIAREHVLALKPIRTTKDYEQTLTRLKVIFDSENPQIKGEELEISGISIDLVSWFSH